MCARPLRQACGQGLKLFKVKGSGFRLQGFRFRVKGSVQRFWKAAQGLQQGASSYYLYGGFRKLGVPFLGGPSVMKNIQYVRLSRVRSPCLCKPLFILGFKVEISYMLRSKT